MSEICSFLFVQTCNAWQLSFSASTYFEVLKPWSEVLLNVRQALLL